MLLRWWHRLRHQLHVAHPAAIITGMSAATFAVLFGSLGVQNQRNFGTWSYDMGIYDQGLWLLSRGSSTFMSVRGLDFWGHHLNIIGLAFVPFYWMGAGPSFLYVVQASALGLGAVPVYLIARDKFQQEWMGLVFALVYLLYAPVQWISWAMFHPEALVITPLLFAWWFATRARWGWYAAMVLVVLSTREDAALAVVMLGLVLLVQLRASPDRRRLLAIGVGTSAIGLLWYLLATNVVIPHFNGGRVPFYVTFFYGDYGHSTVQIVGGMLRHPGRVVHDMVQPDRLSFYHQLSWPVGWTYLANPLALLIAAPQMLASVIGSTPYARMIKYQYTSVMIAPIMIASIQGAFVFWRFRVATYLLPAWLLGCSIVTNLQWAPSPWNDRDFVVWAQPDPRHDSLRQALSYVPPGASVTASYQLLPHLTHRRHIYDWPNPFAPAVWGNDDCVGLPDPRTVEYVVLDMRQVTDSNRQLFDDMTVAGGPFETLFVDDTAIVLHRVGTSQAVDVIPQRIGCEDRLLALRRP
jgi:uncharacterized membrane protein